MNATKPVNAFIKIPEYLLSIRMQKLNTAKIFSQVNKILKRSSAFLEKKLIHPISEVLNIRLRQRNSNKIKQNISKKITFILIQKRVRVARDLSLTINQNTKLRC